jgi:formylglycine-generating enzyme required for sulfatase activity
MAFLQLEGNNTMNMYKMILLSIAAVCAQSAITAPVVSEVTFDQHPINRTVTVAYRIDEPAIVTVDIQTNRGDGVFASIGTANLRGFVGEVNKLVTNVNKSVSLTWRPDLHWNQGSRITGENVKAVVTAWATNAPPDYMVINLIDRDEVRYYVDTDAMPYPVTDDRYKRDYLVMRRIHAAGIPWRMGSTSVENSNRQADEVPHTVTLTEDYYIGIFEFTIGQWMQCDVQSSTGVSSAGIGGKSWANALKPATQADYKCLRGASDGSFGWPDTGHQVRPGSAIADMRSKLGIEVDLPTEAQWEYACRAGTTGAVYGDEFTEAFISSTAAYTGNTSSWDAHDVGSFQPNPWGLYDMYGGQMEQCLDAYNASVSLADLPSIDPQGAPKTGTSDKTSIRVLRGNAWNDVWYKQTSTWRAHYDETIRYVSIGFRLAAPCIAPNKAK